MVSESVDLSFFGVGIGWYNNPQLVIWVKKRCRKATFFCVSKK